jgi:hypothetical protein
MSDHDDGNVGLLVGCNLVNGGLNFLLGPCVEC